MGGRRRRARGTAFRSDDRVSCRKSTRGARRARVRAAAMLRDGRTRFEHRLDNARSSAPSHAGETAATPVAPTATWSAAVPPDPEPTPTLSDPAWPESAAPLPGERQGPVAAGGEWVPPAVGARWPTNGVTPAIQELIPNARSAPSANGDETWPKRPVSTELASPTIRLLTTPERDKDVVGYQHQPSSPTEDVVLSGPTPRIEQPRQWAELQAEAAAWLARREEDISKADNGASPSILTPGANGHHSSKRAQG